MVHWKKNLLFIWLSQFLSMAGFAFAMPFAPYFIQELGVTDPTQLKLWIAAFACAAPISLAIFGPIWGWIADRYGRRPMLLRANLGGAFLLAFMGGAQSVKILVLLRICQGILTGTMTAAQTLVASHTPDSRSGFAMGTLSSAVFSGAMAGVALGGVFADTYGFRNAFFLASGLLVIASLLVLFGTQETFVSDAPTGGNAGLRMRRGAATLSPVANILFAICLISLLRRFDIAYLALLVQDIHGSVDGAATLMGQLSAIASAAGFLAGFICGHIGDRYSPIRVARLGALLGGLLMLPHFLAYNMPTLYALRFGMAFCMGGIEPMFQALLLRASPPGERGFIFGWAATMRAVGWGFAPILSGIVAALFNIRAIYLTGGALLIIFAIFTPKAVRRAG